MVRLGKALGAMLALVALLLAVASPVQAETVTIKMGTDKGQLAFEPKVVTIAVGDTVKWVNNKAFPHNVVVTGHDELSAKKLLQKPGQAIEVTFTKPGEYDYYCTPHRGAGMVGKIVVKG